MYNTLCMHQILHSKILYNIILKLTYYNSILYVIIYVIFNLTFIVTYFKYIF